MDNHDCKLNLSPKRKYFDEVEQLSKASPFTQHPTTTTTVIPCGTPRVGKPCRMLLVFFCFFCDLFFCLFLFLFLLLLLLLLLLQRSKGGDGYAPCQDQVELAAPPSDTRPLPSYLLPMNMRLFMSPINK